MGNSTNIFSSSIISKSTLLEKIILWISIIGFALLLIIPSVFGASYELVKIEIVSLIVLASVISILIYKIRNGISLVMPKSTLFFSLIALVISSAISSLLSTSFSKSFFGNGADGISLAVFFSVFVLFCILYFVFKNKERINNFGLYSTILLGLFSIFSFVNTILVIFKISPINTIGMWSDVSIIVSITVLLSAILIKNFKFSGLYYFLLNLIFGISIVTVILNAFWFIQMWIILAILSLLLLISYFIENGKGFNIKKIFPVIPLLIVFIVSVLLIAMPVKIAKTSATIFNIGYIDSVSTSWKVTTDTFGGMLNSSPFFGKGLQMYLNEYWGSRTSSANVSGLSGMDYPYATGIIPTMMISTGIIGSILWILFLIFIYIYSIGIIFKNKVYKSNFTAISSAVASFFSWAMLFVHVSSITIFIIAIISTVLLVISLVNQERIKEIECKITKNSFGKIIGFILLIIVIIISALIAYSFTKKIVSSSYLRKAQNELSTTQDINKAESYIVKYIDTSKNDTAYRNIAQYNVGKISKLLSAVNEKNGDEINKAVLSLFQGSVLALQSAINYDPYNYLNYVAYGNLAEIGMDLKAEGAYDLAKNNYLKAIEINPEESSLYINLANLEAKNKKIKEATEYLRTGIVKLSPIENAELYYNYANLLYVGGDYNQALQVLDRAVLILPDYANARYLAALTFIKLNDNANALNQLEIISKANPDNQDIKNMIDQLTKQIKNLQNKTTEKVKAKK